MEIARAKIPFDSNLRSVRVTYLGRASIDDPVMRSWNEFMLLMEVDEIYYIFLWLVLHH